MLFNPLGPRTHTHTACTFTGNRALRYETFGWWRSPELRAVHLAEDPMWLLSATYQKQTFGAGSKWATIAFPQAELVELVVKSKWAFNTLQSNFRIKARSLAAVCVEN
eukprot:3779769-Amphidinium_carterae.2